MPHMHPSLTLPLHCRGALLDSTVKKAPRPVSRLRHSRGRRGAAPRWAGRRPTTSWALTRCAAAGRARIRAYSAPSRSLPSDHRARSALAGTSTRAAERAGGFGATAHVPGVVAVAIAATADLSAAHRGRFREVRRVRKKRCMCVCAAAWPLRCRMPPPPPRRCPRLAPTSPTTHPARFAALAQAAAPPQRRRSAAAARRAGPPQRPLGGPQRP